MADAEILLIRHAESVWNAERRWQGQEDPPLSARGLDQARCLARELAGAGVEAILCSDLLRARATAEALAQALRLELRTDPRLRELDVGRWGGRTRDEIAGSEPELLSRFDAGDRAVAAGGGESRRALRRRALAALRDLAEADSSGCIAVVSHLGWLREVLPGTDFGHAEWRNARLSWLLASARADGSASDRRIGPGSGS